MRNIINIFLSVLMFACGVAVLTGCNDPDGYSFESQYPQTLQTVYIQMFDNRTFRRDVEYELTNALAKRIEAQTPYKIVSSLDSADSVINGQIISINESTLSSERQTGRSLEKEVEITAIVNWKDLKTGYLLLDNRQAAASASFSQWQSQGIEYGYSLAANKLAERIVELMEKDW